MSKRCHRDMPPFLAAQEELPVELPLDGTAVELLRLPVPDRMIGSMLKVDGFFQSNFLLIEFEDREEISNVLLPYQYEVAYQVMVESDDAIQSLPVTPILLDTVSGVQQQAPFQVTHNTNPNFTLAIPSVTGDIVLKAYVAKAEGGVKGAFVNTRAINATVF